MPLDIYLHTNRPIRPLDDAPALSGLRVHTGWYADDSGVYVEALQAKFDEQQQRQGLKKWNLHQVLKYEWLLRRLIADRPPGHPDRDRPWVLADTDTLFTCGADEAVRRFQSFNTELVVAVEKQRRGVHKPLPSHHGEVRC